MRAPELTPRLAAIAAQVPPGACIADVGTDHAYLPVWLTLQGIPSAAIASDLREGPLHTGRLTAAQYEVADRIDFRLCGGLDDIRPEEADTVIIAGMGGELIASILEAAPWTKDALLLLQPMSTQAELRGWLCGHGYRIERERIVPEGERQYVILTVRGGTSEPYTPAELLAGKNDKSNPDPYRAAYLAHQIAREEKALAGMLRSAAPPETRVRESEILLLGLRQLHEEWTAWQR